MPWWTDPVAGGAAGVLQDAIMHPVDTIRARLDMGVGVVSAHRKSVRLPTVAEPTRHAQGGRQTSRSTTRALYRMASRTIANEGLRGLYGGYGVVLVGSGPASALYLGGYKLLGRHLSEHHALPFANPIAGFCAEVLALVVYTPLDVAKQRLQVAPAKTTVRSMMRGLIRERGVRGLWAGYWAGLVVWGPYSAIFFGVYETAKAGLASLPLDNAQCVDLQDGSKGHPAIDFVAGTLGGTVGAVLTQPLDCIKTRVQVGGQQVSSVLDCAERAPPKRELLATFRVIVSHEGPQALFRGTAARALWLAPGAGITIMLFETLHRQLELAVGSASLD